MKNKLIISTLVLFTSISAFGNEKKERVGVSDSTKETVMAITLLFCPTCVLHVASKLNEMPTAKEKEEKKEPKVIQRGLASEPSKK